MVEAPVNTFVFWGTKHGKGYLIVLVSEAANDEVDFCTFSILLLYKFVLASLLEPYI